VSLPSSSKGSRLSGIIPPPNWKGGMGLNLNRIERDNMAYPRITSLYKKESKGIKGGNKTAQLIIKKTGNCLHNFPAYTGILLLVASSGPMHHPLQLASKVPPLTEKHKPIFI